VNGLDLEVAIHKNIAPRLSAGLHRAQSRQKDPEGLFLQFPQFPCNR
jgi:hypothetical protein